MEGNNLKTKTYKQVDLQSVARFVRNKEYQSTIKDKGDKVDSRRACRKFSDSNGHLYHKRTRQVVFSTERQQNIIHDIHRFG